MLYINKITSDPSQQLILTGIPGLSINMSLRYMPRNQLWTMDINAGNFTCNGIVVVSSLNMMRQFKNNIDFGIACVTTNGLDPYNVDDFSTQAANMYLLSAADVAEIEASLAS